MVLGALKTLTIAGKSSVPVVAIGGISRQNIEQLRGDNALSVAVCSALCSSTEPKKEAELLVKKLKG